MFKYEGLLLFIILNYETLSQSRSFPIKFQSESRLRLGTTPLPTPLPTPVSVSPYGGKGAATRRLKQRLKNYVSSYHPWLCSLAITNNINAIFVLKKATARTRKKEGKLLVSEFRSPSPAVLKHLNLNMKKKRSEFYSRIDLRLV